MTAGGMAVAGTGLGWGVVRGRRAQGPRRAGSRHRRPLPPEPAAHPLRPPLHPLSSNLGCREPGCALCAHNPRRACVSALAPKCLAGDAFKAREAMGSGWVGGGGGGVVGGERRVGWRAGRPAESPTPPTPLQAACGADVRVDCVYVGGADPSPPPPNVVVEARGRARCVQGGVAWLAGRSRRGCMYAPHTPMAKPASTPTSHRNTPLRPSCKCWTAKHTPPCWTRGAVATQRRRRRAPCPRTTRAAPYWCRARAGAGAAGCA